MIRILLAAAFTLALVPIANAKPVKHARSAPTWQHHGGISDVSSARRFHPQFQRRPHHHDGMGGHRIADRAIGVPVRARSAPRMDIAASDRDGRWGASVDRPREVAPSRSVARWAARRPVVRHSNPVRQIVTGAVAAITGLASLPGELAAKVAEIAGACPGFHVISGCRPGARVAGTRIVSLHASCRAADIAGPNYGCAYAHLQGWPGGVSTDPERVAHIHLSWAPGSREQGARFRHGGGGGRYVHRYARHGHWRRG